MQAPKRQKLTDTNAFKKRCIELYRELETRLRRGGARRQRRRFSAVVRYEQKVSVTVLLINLRTSMQTSFIISLL